MLTVSRWGWIVLFPALRPARKFRAAQYESDRKADLARWASSKIAAMPLRANSFRRDQSLSSERERRRSSRNAGRRAAGPNMGASEAHHSLTCREASRRWLTARTQDPSHRSTHK